MEALGLHLPQLIAQIVGFLVLLFILSKLLYKPLLKVIDERSAKIKESLEAAESAKEQAAASQEQMQEDIRKAREEGQQMIAQARDVAARFRDEEMAKARDEISAERAKAEADIQRERDAGHRGPPAGVRRTRYQRGRARGGALAQRGGPSRHHRQSDRRERDDW